MSIDEYPIIDFSEIPGCESPIVPRSLIRSTTTSNRLTNSTKSRISSIFSSTVDSIGDDDPFDLKASARKLKPIRESIVNTGRLVDIDFAESPNKGGLTDWNKMMFEASVIASDIKDEEKIVDLDEIMNKSPLVDASPLSCMNKIGGGEALLLETSSPENSPLKFRFDEYSEPRKKLWDKENRSLQKPTEPLKEVYIDDQLEKAIKRKPLANLNKRQVPMKTPTKTLMKPPGSTKRVSLAPSKPVVTSSKPAMIKSRLPMTPSKVPMTPSKLPMTPSKLPMTPSRLPMTPSKLPMTPSKLPMTPSRLPKTQTNLSNRTPLIPSRQPPMKPSLNTVTPVRDQKLTIKSNSTNPRRSILLSKPNGAISSQPNVKSSLNTRRSIMTPTLPSTTNKKSNSSQTMSSTPKIGPVLARPLLSSTSNVKSTNLVQKRRSIQPLKSFQR